MKNEPFIWLKQDFDGEWIEVHPNKGTPLYTTPQIKELSDEEILFTENEVNVLKNAIENYVYTLKAELTEEQRKFKGYERCSDIKAIVNELKDAERALEILKKASEK